MNSPETSPGPSTLLICQFFLLRVGSTLYHTLILQTPSLVGEVVVSRTFLATLVPFGRIFFSAVAVSVWRQSPGNCWHFHTRFFSCTSKLGVLGFLLQFSWEFYLELNIRGQNSTPSHSLGLQMWPLLGGIHIWRKNKAPEENSLVGVSSEVIAS